MPKVVIDANFVANLLASSEAVKVVDPDGKVVGEFIPRPSVADLDPGISDEEIRQRFAAGGGRPLADIMRDLEARG